MSFQNAFLAVPYAARALLCVKMSLGPQLTPYMEVAPPDALGIRHK